MVGGWLRVKGLKREIECRVKLIKQQRIENYSINEVKCM